ncbi:heparinase II/III domain-containing protein [Rahnella aceris]|uniref:heparinase II/III domain-containing protein n=1 Tax=Rahnella sp. (strain Y9602) TaxID=2703885 RepID=UPI001C2516EC|nr:heparinase II/III family protein [Rahnella aceris]MBU9849129.1 heparinase II/III family protein [Rahnella aceris]
MNHWQPLQISAGEAYELRGQINADSPLGAALRAQITTLENMLVQPLTIPGHGEAGGPEHTQHKQNYLGINLAGRLALITGEPRFADYTLALLTGYADIYPSLGSATSKDSNAPGRLFHQTLNENMFWLYAVEGYHCVMPSLSAAQREHIETNLFQVMADDALNRHTRDFDIVHNHGIWSVAAAAISGYVLDDTSLVEKALYGLKGDSESGGFFAQLSQLFSPDGYYIEGPYYHRFALRPLLLLAEAIERRQPDLQIYQFREQIIRKTCEALMQTAFPDGVWPALNDSSKTINIRDDGAVIAASVCYSRYDHNPQWIAVAQQQQTVWVSAAALKLSAALKKAPATPVDWGSVELRDGPQGTQGGIGILRSDAENQDMALMWYGQHGSIPRLHSALNHGHFDGLHLSLFSGGREFLRDYGFGRWVNVEPKFGGRYIPENNSYCKQTVAHNTVVVDGQSQNGGNSLEAETRWGEPHFFVTGNPACQGMSARLNDYYPGVNQQRTVLMLSLPELSSPLIVDVFRLTSHELHQYDYCLHHLGQFVRSDAVLDAASQLTPLGEDHGYQHLWDCARADIAAGDSALFSWLDGDSYRTLVSAFPDVGELIVARTGASDPNFNLRNEPALLLRIRGTNAIFASVFETHGYFDEASETSLDARGKVERVSVVSHDDVQTELNIYFAANRTLNVRISNRTAPAAEDAFSVAWQSVSPLNIPES